MAWIWHKRDLVVSGIFAEWKVQGLSIIGGDRLREEDTTKEEEKRQWEAARAANSGWGGKGGSSRMVQRGGAVIGSKEAAEKVCSQSRFFMKYHSLMGVL